MSFHPKVARTGSFQGIFAMRKEAVSRLFKPRILNAEPFFSGQCGTSLIYYGCPMLIKILKPPIRALTFVLILILLILLFPCSLAKAQGISWGLSAGVPLNGLAIADSSRVARTMRFTFGPSLRVALPHGFGVDLDLLYKRLDFGFASYPARITAHHLELVPLLRYSFGSSPIRPFVHAGMPSNWVLARGGSDACVDAPAGGKGYLCIDRKTVAQLRHSHTHGFVLGGGLDFESGVLHLVPELRVTRWLDRNIGTQDSPLRSNLNQVEILMGFLF
jgi:hypothetical protein